MKSSDDELNEIRDEIKISWWQKLFSESVADLITVYAELHASNWWWGDKSFHPRLSERGRSDSCQFMEIRCLRRLSMAWISFIRHSDGESTRRLIRFRWSFLRRGETFPALSRLNSPRVNRFCHRNSIFRTFSRESSCFHGEHVRSTVRRSDAKRFSVGLLRIIELIDRSHLRLMSKQLQCIDWVISLLASSAEALSQTIPKRLRLVNEASQRRAEMPSFPFRIPFV